MALILYKPFPHLYSSEDVHFPLGSSQEHYNQAFLRLVQKHHEIALYESAASVSHSLDEIARRGFSLVPKVIEIDFFGLPVDSTAEKKFLSPLKPKSLALYGGAFNEPAEYRLGNKATGPLADLAYRLREAGFELDVDFKSLYRNEPASPVQVPEALRRSPIFGK